MSRKEIPGMFPKRWWVQVGPRKAFGAPLWRGGDEWGQETICISIPFVITLVIAWRITDSEYFDGFECTFPGCPYYSMAPGDPCMTHDVELWTGLMDEDSEVMPK